MNNNYYYAFKECQLTPNRIHDILAPDPFHGIWFARYGIKDYRLKKWTSDNTILEWIDFVHFTEWKFEEFNEFNFKQYFTSVNRNSEHFGANMNYYAMLLNGDVKRIYGTGYFALSKIKQRHLIQKVEHLLINDLTGFYLILFDNLIKKRR